MAVDGETESPSMGILVLRLRLGSTEPPNGTIGALGEATGQSFYGWIDLMSAINRLRGWRSLEPGEFPSPASPSQDPA
jgi:hypothetical protein